MRTAILAPDENPRIARCSNLGRGNDYRDKYPKPRDEPVELTPNARARSLHLFRPSPGKHPADSLRQPRFRAHRRRLAQGRRPDRGGARPSLPQEDREGRGDVATIAALGAEVEDLIKQNNAIDIYEEYFAGSQADHSSEQPYAKTLTVFRDPSEIKRSASYISWNPDVDNRKCAVAYSILGFQEQPEGMSKSSYIWDVNSPNRPDFELRGPSQLCCVNYNPKDTNVISGGMYNGQVGYWDVRKGHTPVDTSPIEKSHRDPCYDMDWLQSKTGTECFSVSTDGMVFWWDTRRLGEPVEELQLKEKNSDVVLGAVSVEYESIAGPTKFMIGTEQGTVLMCNRKAKNPQDRVGTAYHGHHGPVYSLERNPFNPKFFMSIGDWSARI